MLHSFRGHAPQIAADAWIAASAVVVGDVVIGAQSSVWFHTVVRGDVAAIRIGARTNLQDHVVVHVFGGRSATTIGDDVTIGHRALLHGCTIGNRALIGMGAILLDGAEIGDECLIGAGSLVPPGTKIPARSLALGNPARFVRPLKDEERDSLKESAARYVGYAAEYRAAGIA